MLQIETCLWNNLDIDRNEVLRYTGCGNNSANTEVTAAIEKCIASLQPKLVCKACYDYFDITKSADDILDLGFMNTSSENLIKSLNECEKIILFTATVGIEPDRLINRYSSISPFNALVVQAVGAAAIEAWCDILCRRFEEKEKQKSNYLRPRFSPGYGDFPLSAQKRIFEVLDCSRKIGVTLTDNCLMIPSKSVSAIIGISKTKLNCTPHGCEACNKIYCEYKRGH